MKYIEFAGASNSKKSVVFFHGDHLKYAPPAIVKWTDIASDWLTNTPVGLYYMDGEKISNYKDQWVIGVVYEN